MTRESLEARAALAREIGEQIRAHRVARGMTQQQVAEPTFTKAYISALETGIARPSMRALHYIAEKLNVAPSMLMGDGEGGLAPPVDPTIVWVRFGDERLYAEMDDGRELGVPLRDQALRRMRLEDLQKWRISPDGRGVAWPSAGVQLGLRDFFGLPAPMTTPGPSAEMIGERVRRAREERGLTQSQLAGQRFTAAYISQIENARVALTTSAVGYIADRLRIRRSDLLGVKTSDLAEVPPLLAQGVRIMDGRLYVALADGRELGLPFELIPKLLAHSMDELARWSIARAGAAIRWSALGFEILIDEYGRLSLEVERE